MKNKFKKITLPLFTSEKGMDITLIRELFNVTNKFQNVRIIETKEFGNALLIDGIMQGSEKDHEIYDNELLQNLNHNDKDILILGGGDGFIADTILKRHPSINSIDIVDIDNDLVENCGKHFTRQIIFNEKVNFHIQDALIYLKTIVNKKYSAVIFDLTEIPVANDKNIKTFFQNLINLVKPIIQEDGWISVQAGTPTVTNKYFDLSAYLSVLFSNNFKNITKNSIFIPCFGEEASFLNISLKLRHVIDLQDKVIISDSNLIGGKGYALHQLFKADFNIPDAFVITSIFFEDYLKANSIYESVFELINSLKNENESVLEVSRKLNDLFKFTKFKQDQENSILEIFKKKKFKNVAVRSSATLEDGKENAWAGQLETLLNVNEKNLLTSIKECIGSLFSTHALTYIRENELYYKKIAVAVVIQEMIDAEISGVGFSINPVTQNNEIIIESVMGLGDYLVSGKITPSRFTFSKEKNLLLNKILTNQKIKLCLDNISGTKEISVSQKENDSFSENLSWMPNLCEEIKKSENFFKFPQDVEWCLKGTKLYILQSRPITTISNNSQKIDFSKYIKIYTVENIFPPLFIDIAIKSKYLKYDGIFIFENYITTLLIEKKAFIKANNLGAKKLLSGNYLEEAKINIKIIKSGIKKLKNTLTEINSSKNLEDFLDKYIEIFSLALYEYSFTEYFYSKGAENVINKKLKKIFNENYYESLLYEIVNDPYKFKNRIPKDLYKAILNLHLSGKEKLLFRSLMNDLAVIYVKFISKFQKIKKIPDEFIDHLLLSELKLIYNESFLEKMITTTNLRREYFVLVKNKNLISRFDSQIANEIINSYKNFQKIISSNNILKGHGVYAGHFTGIVKKVPYFMDTDDVEYLECLNSFKEGEILVARSTGPELLPIIKKSGAVIAEEGGIMSHAAVVCREFKKPGVVGISNIFEILKDGQKVFVDGQSGTIVLEK